MKRFPRTRVALPAAALLLALRAAPAAAAEHPAPDTLDRVVPIPEVTVSTTRLPERAPVARATLDRAALQRRNTGQDTGMLLATLPGAYAYSDAGNGIGYSYLSIRGFPQRRISVLVDEVPLNDPQSHEVYWIDHPDLASSMRSVTVQRGVGSALHGGASLGGSVIVETGPFTEHPGASVLVGGGSWGTRRLSAEARSGEIEARWNLAARWSRITTDGYRERSGSELWSYFLGVRRRAGDHVLRASLFGGPEETELAYYGVPREVLNGGLSGDPRRDRRVNPLSWEGEKDHFFEPHAHLQHAWAIAPGVSFAQTLFHTEGDGFYDERRYGERLSDYRLAPWATADTTLHPREYYARDAGGALVRDSLGRAIVERFDGVRRRSVATRHSGWIPRLRLEHGAGAVTVGGELRANDARRWGALRSGDGPPPGTGPDHRYYDYHPRTFAASLFVREEWSPRQDLLVTGDLRWRHQRYRLADDRFDRLHFTQRYDFANPRLGVTWTPREDLRLFASWAAAAREPAFRDLYDAEGAGNLPLYRVADPATSTFRDPLIDPERVSSWEAGATWRRPWGAFAANAFRMDFRDELVFAGQFDTDLGYPILGNAARSVHQGLELAGRAARGLGPVRLELDANATLSDNHFVDFVQFDTRFVPASGGGDSAVSVPVDFGGNAIGQFPATIANLAATLRWRGVALTWETQALGRMYLDAREDRDASIGPHALSNAALALRLPAGGSAAELSLRVNNVFDRLTESGGYTYGDGYGNTYVELYPAATRNWLAQVRLEF